MCSQHLKAFYTLPDGFHRIRHYGFLANGVRVAAIAKARALLSAAAPEQTASCAEPQTYAAPCPFCGGRMILVERFERGAPPPHAPSPFRIGKRKPPTPFRMLLTLFPSTGLLLRAGGMCDLMCVHC